MTADLFTVAGAALSEDGLYRYRLWREWAGGPRAVFVMLNPSTADAETDDPTLRRCMGFARAWGCGGVTVVNLFAFRTPYPRALARAADPVGPANGWFLRRAVREAREGHLIAAWGRPPPALAGQARRGDMRLRGLAELGGVPMQCLGRTEDGAWPRHPLMMPKEAGLGAWP